MSRPWLAAALTVFLWASAFVAIRAALRGFTAGELSVLRVVVASLALAAGAPFVGVRRPARRDLPALLACGATGMTAYQLLLNAGERTVTAGTASLLVSTGPDPRTGRWALVPYATAPAALWPVVSAARNA